MLGEPKSQGAARRGYRVNYRSISAGSGAPRDALPPRAFGMGVQQYEVYKHPHIVEKTTASGSPQPCTAST